MTLFLSDAWGSIFVALKRFFYATQLFPSALHQCDRKGEILFSFFVQIIS